MEIIKVPIQGESVVAPVQHVAVVLVVVVFTMGLRLRKLFVY